MRNQLFIASVLVAAGAGCGVASSDSLQVPDVEVPDVGVQPEPVARTLHISPRQLTVQVVNGATVVEPYIATMVGADGSERDVTAITQFEVEDARFGQFAGNELLVSGDGAGPVTVRASAEGVTTAGQLTVFVKDIRLEGDVPAEAPALFDAAQRSTRCNLAVTYPAGDLVAPRNLGELDVHWATRDHDIFEVAFTGPFMDLRVYTTGRPDAYSYDANRWTRYDGRDWKRMTETRAGMTLQVTGIHTQIPTVKCGPDAQAVAITNEAVAGGVYYWTTDWEARARGENGQDVLRYDLSTPDIAPAPLFAGDQKPASCVGCHAVSRDGRYVAVTFEGAGGTGSVLDLVQSRMMMPTDETAPSWSAAAFTADASKLVTVEADGLKLRRTDGGEVLATVPATPGMISSNPEISPRNNLLVSVETPSGADWAFEQGSVVVRTYDDKTNAFGPAQTLLPYEPAKGLQSYYPSWSPDGQWLAVTRAPGGTSYNNPDAEVWVVKADGTQPPMRVAGFGGTGDSWARWLPFVAAAGDEPVYYLSFSSTRAYGAIIPDGGRPQIWMVPFYPERAQVGTLAVGTPFRAPFQSAQASNHAAQWTTQVMR